jgi:hypothetical protein
MMLNTLSTIVNLFSAVGLVSFFGLVFGGALLLLSYAFGYAFLGG